MTTVHEGASAPSTVLNLSAGPDTGGQMIRTKHAFDRYSDWSMRCVVNSVSYMEYGTDLRWDDRLVEKLWAAADVVHVHRQISHYLGFDEPKPMVLHHHGTLFRQQSARQLAKAAEIGAVNVVSTIDLLRYGPDLTWLPSPHDLDWLASLRKPNRTKTVRIVHAPTNREVKSTDLIIRVVKRLAERYPIEFTLVEDRPWLECLAAKARADILIDQLNLGYGNNALEAWGMGIPVVAGAEPDTRDRMLDMLGSLPFYEADEVDLYPRLEALVADKALRTQYGRLGRTYVRQWHSGETVVRLLESLYERAIVERKPSRSAVARPVQNRLQPYEVEPGVFRHMTPAMAGMKGLA
jgi:glycosyltransferase involved in cell wall biosynthesis